MISERKAVLGRRQFLHAFGAGTAATVMAPLTTEVMADSESHDGKRKSRYRETDHVKQYYLVNRYPR
jgi:hypothetical protein